MSEALASEVRALPAAAWGAPTNCPPWQVRDLAAHVASTGFAFVTNVRRGLAGSVDPAPSRSSPLADDADPTRVTHALTASTAEFLSLYEDLRNEQLDRICYHRRGNRSVRWYASHRLAELAFHRWDLLVSCGKPPDFPAEVARLLLPTLLESNAPRTYAAGLSKERGRGERFQLCVDDDPSAQWLVTISPEGLSSTRSAAASSPDLTITADAATLALLVYGRLELPDIVAEQRAHAVGDPALIDRFGRIFPRP